MPFKNIYRDRGESSSLLHLKDRDEDEYEVEQHAG